jgi:hypothetical protein
MKKTLLKSLTLALILIGCQDENPAGPIETRLDYYVESYQVQGLDFQPQLKVVYHYNEDGSVEKYRVASYDPSTQSFNELRYFAFEYANGRVDKIEGFLTNSTEPYIQYLYEYDAGGGVAKILENNFAAQLTSQAVFTQNTDQTLQVAYSYSNGGSFEYEFNLLDSNIYSDKTTRGSQICSTGSYTYDLNINPFSKLGYVDYTLTNLSKNNRLTENVNYLGCAFPSIIPEAYSYEYDAKGYPIIATTTYKGSNAIKSQKKLYYKEIVK